VKNVSEVSRLTGVSVRTLHHYDAVGLLHPTMRTDAGYRLYDDAALARLQAIMMFRELEFPLEDIRRIMDAPDFSVERAVLSQIELLKLRKDHIDELIKLAENILKKGENNMNFHAFDRSEIQKYEAEVKQKWGGTEAYTEYVSKPKSDDPTEQLMCKFAEFGAIRNGEPTSADAQNKVAELQGFITDRFYTCSKEILASLGGMYVADERFRQNIDAVGGEGTAEFVSKAIAAFCK